MRDLPTSFAGVHYSKTKEPIYVVSIEFAADDVVYMTSHRGVAVPALATVFPACVEKISGTTQQIAPDEGRSTIGNISFNVIDKDGAISLLLATKDAAGKGIRSKRVRVYQAFSGMVWEEIKSNLVQTQMVDDLAYSTGAYLFKCVDIQRSMRTDIFDLATTRLSRGIDATQLKIPVYAVNGFESLMHGASFTDAPNSRVGYIRVEDEIIRWTRAGMDPEFGLCFVADKRGALGSRAVAHEVDEGSSEDQRPEVEEFVYLEMPAIKLAYALLTGNLYGQLGENLPSKWHLGISGEWIRTNDFLSIGLDLWDPDTDDGFIVRFVGLDKRDAKKFIEKELCLLTASYMPIYSNGELGLRRFSSVLHTAPYVYELNEDCVVKTGDLGIDLKAVNNLLSVEWNYDVVKDKLTRQRIIRDVDSIEKYGESTAKSLQFAGLSGSRHTTSTVEGLFDRIRDRYAAPPHRLTLRCLPRTNVVEVGDVVRVNLPSLRDSFTGQPLDRAMEVQQVSINWETGQVDIKLFGSTQPATPLLPSMPGGNNPDPSLAVLPDSFYSYGVNIAAHPQVTLTVVGGVGHITSGGLGITGGPTVNSTILHYDGDLEIDAGVLLAFSQNIQLRVRGHLQINGTLTGKGRGHLGAPAATAAGYPLGGNGIHLVNYGTPGYIGPTESGGGVTSWIQFGKDRWEWTSWRGWQTPGQVQGIPALTIVDWGGVAIAGLPKDLRGTSGASGRNSYNDDTHDNNFYVDGGAGGASGAGLVIISRGVSFGAAGTIDVSGNDGQLGVNSAGGRLIGGAGAGGAPGGVIFVIDGVANEIPELSRITARFGASPLHVGTHLLTEPGKVSYHPPLGETITSYWRGYSPTPPDLSGYGGASRIFFVPPKVEPAPDLPDDAAAAVAITATELINTPRTTAGDRSTIEVAVTPPADTAYAYSQIYMREAGSTAWQYQGAADDELDIVVASDGKTYEIQPRSVSVFKVESPTGPITTITVTSMNAQRPANVVNARINHVGNLNQIYWDRIDDDRIVDYEIRNGLTWANSTAVSRVVMPMYNAQGNGTFWVAARIIGVDGGSVYSAMPLQIVINEAVITRNIVATFDEAATGWSGVLAGGAEVGVDVLQLAGTGNILAAPNFLAVPDVLHYGEVASSGSYTFPAAHTINIGRVAPCTVQVNLDLSILWLASGDAPETLPLEVIVTPQIALSQDGVTWGDWQDYQVGIYTFRAVKARVLLASTNVHATPQVRNLQILVDVPDRVDRRVVATLATGVVNVAYTSPFNGGPDGLLIPFVTPTINGATSGDTVRITNQTLSGFDIDVVNGGARVVRSVNIRAEGY